MTNCIKKTLAFAVLILFSCTTFADLLVSPSRIAFSERDRTKDIILLNNTDEVRSYRIEWINQSQSDSGKYSRLEGDGLTDFPRADQFIRFSPRRVTLQPNESQTVKLMARRKSNMNEPEYRSHLLFTALPRSLTEEQQEEAPSNGVNIKLNLLLSYSIPIVLRTEKPATDVSFSNLQIKNSPNGQEALQFSMSKSDTNSVFGDFTVLHELGGETTEIGYLNNVNVFREVNTYTTHINLLRPVSGQGGELKLRYKGKAEFADKLLEEASISIQ